MPKDITASCATVQSIASAFGNSAIEAQRTPASSISALFNSVSVPKVFRLFDFAATETESGTYRMTCHLYHAPTRLRHTADKMACWEG